MKINQKRLRKMTAEYAAQFRQYKAYAKLLREVLGRASRRYAPGAFIEARPKTLASFAEKVVRKQSKFETDRNYDLTDRCGARVVVQSTDDAAAICDYIAKNFEIDGDNSLKHEDRLEATEFGYRSIHYVVWLKDRDTELEGLEIPPFIRAQPKRFKAEIQIRTLAEHVLASGLHDRLYKVRMPVPKPLQRESASLAAALESVDKRYAALAAGFDACLGFSAYRKKSQIADERVLLEAVRKHDKDPARMQAFSLQLAALACAEGDWEAAVDELEAAHTKAKFPSDELKVRLAYALCCGVRCQPGTDQFKRAKALLQEVVQVQRPERNPETGAERSMRAQALHRLGWCHELENNIQESRRRYFEAWELDRRNPYFLMAFLASEMASDPTRRFVRMTEPVLREARSVCQLHVEVGLEIPKAHFTLARFHLLLRDLTPALTSYAAGIARITEVDASTPEQCLHDELQFLRHITATEVPVDIALARVVRTALEAVLVVKTGRTSEGLTTDDARNAERVAAIAKRRGQSTLIIAGGAKFLPPENVREYRALIGSTLRQATGTVLYGGTTAGIPGVVGEMATAVARKGSRRFLLIGYRAQRFSPGTNDDSANADIIVVSDSATSSPNEPLMGWTDLIRAGVKPRHVQLLCINGGPIAAFEMRFALSLGARVGVVRKSGRAADAILADPSWKDHPRLVPLPPTGLDDAIMRAFVCNSRFTLPEEDLEVLAQLVHEDYLRKMPHAESDFSPDRRHWRGLSDDMKESNRQQVLYATEILATEGFRLEKWSGSPTRIRHPSFADQQVERMAKLEHGRWCIERFTARWNPGPVKDADRRTHPALAPFDELPENLKVYDRQAVRNYSRVFKVANYAIVKAGSTVTKSRRKVRR